MMAAPDESRYHPHSGRYRRVPQICGRTKRRPGEPWRAYALRLSDIGWSARQIAGLLRLHHTTVLYAINPEMKRDKLRQQRRRAAERSPEDVRLDTLARRVRKDMVRASA